MGVNIATAWSSRVNYGKPCIVFICMRRFHEEGLQLRYEIVACYGSDGCWMQAPESMNVEGEKVRGVMKDLFELVWTTIVRVIESKTSEKECGA